MPKIAACAAAVTAALRTNFSLRRGSHQHLEEQKRTHYGVADLDGVTSRDATLLLVPPSFTPSQIDANESSVKQGTGDWMQQESQGLSSLLFATTLFGHRAEVPGELPVALFTAQQFANLGHPEQVPTLDSARPSKGQASMTSDSSTCITIGNILVSTHLGTSAPHDIATSASGANVTSAVTGSRPAPPFLNADDVAALGAMPFSTATAPMFNKSGPRMPFERCLKPLPPAALLVIASMKNPLSRIAPKLHAPADMSSTTTARVHQSEVLKPVLPATDSSASVQEQSSASKANLLISAVQQASHNGGGVSAVNKTPCLSHIARDPSQPPAIRGTGRTSSHDPPTEYCLPAPDASLIAQAAEHTSSAKKSSRGHSNTPAPQVVHSSLPPPLNIKDEILIPHNMHATPSSLDPPPHPSARPSSFPIATRIEPASSAPHNNHGHTLLSPATLSIQSITSTASQTLSTDRHWNADASISGSRVAPADQHRSSLHLSNNSSTSRYAAPTQTSNPSILASAVSNPDRHDQQCSTNSKSQPAVNLTAAEQSRYQNTQQPLLPCNISNIPNNVPSQHAGRNPAVSSTAEHQVQVSVGLGRLSSRDESLNAAQPPNDSLSQLAGGQVHAGQVSNVDTRNSIDQLAILSSNQQIGSALTLREQAVLLRERAASTKEWRNKLAEEQQRKTRKVLWLQGKALRRQARVLESGAAREMQRIHREYVQQRAELQEQGEKMKQERVLMEETGAQLVELWQPRLETQEKKIEDLCEEGEMLKQENAQLVEDKEQLKLEVQRLTQQPAHRYVYQSAQQVTTTSAAATTAAVAAVAAVAAHASSNKCHTPSGSQPGFVPSAAVHSSPPQIFVNSLPSTWNAAAGVYFPQAASGNLPGNPFANNPLTNNMGCGMPYRLYSGNEQQQEGLVHTWAKGQAWTQPQQWGASVRYQDESAAGSVVQLQNVYETTQRSMYTFGHASKQSWDTASVDDDKGYHDDAFIFSTAAPFSCYQQAWPSQNLGGRQLDIESELQVQRGSSGSGFCMGQQGSNANMGGAHRRGARAGAKIRSSVVEASTAAVQSLVSHVNRVHDRGSGDRPSFDTHG